MVACLLAGFFASGPWTLARADDLDDFSFARDAYNNSDYDIAIQRCEALLRRTPALAPYLAVAVRKYLFAALLLTDQRARAVSALEQLLRDEPEVQFNPRDFSTPVAQLVEETRTRMESELERIRHERELAAQSTGQSRERARAELVQLVGSERVIVRRSPWPLFMPFGVGQVSNGQPGWAAVFATAQGLSVGAIATSLVANQINLATRHSDGTRCNESWCAWVLATNMIGWTALGLSVAGGVVHALVHYQPERVEVRRRVPPVRINWPDLGAAASEQGVFASATVRF